MSEKPKYLPEFVCFVEKEKDGSFSAIIGLTGIPNKRYATWTLDKMKRALDDMMVRTLGEFEMDRLKSEKKAEAKATKDEGLKH